MKFKYLECVVLAHDVVEHGLRTGDLGTVVTVYPQNGVEVEFVRVSGSTLATLTLSNSDIRKIVLHFPNNNYLLNQL